MSKKSLIQYIAAFLLVTGVVLLFPNTKWEESTSRIGFISVVCGTLGSIISIFIPSVFVFEFEKNSWSKDIDDYIIKIPSKKHGMGKSPQMQTFQLEKDGYRDIGVDQSFDEKGNITIAACDSFIGRIIVK